MPKREEVTGERHRNFVTLRTAGRCKFHPQADLSTRTSRSLPPFSIVIIILKPLANSNDHL